MSCPICLESNNINYFSCTHGICYTCLNNAETLNGCPLCRQGGQINYQTLYPGTDEYYPQDIINWNNPNFHNIKGQSQDLTLDEIVWITNRWGSLIKKINNINDLEININYIIIIHNNIQHGTFLSRSRDNSDEFLFDNCEILNRDGNYYKSSPPTRNINLVSSNYIVYKLG